MVGKKKKNFQEGDDPEERGQERTIPV